MKTFNLNPIEINLDSNNKILALPYGKVPLSYLVMLIKAGSEKDPKGKEGLADLWAESMTLGTKRRSLEELNFQVEKLGGYLEGSAGWDFSLLILSGLEERGNELLDILFEIISEPDFPSSEIEKAKERRLSNLLQFKDDPSKMADRLIWNMAMEGTPYAHPINGSLSSIKNITPEDIGHFHNQILPKERFTLFILSKELKAEFLKKAEKTFFKLIMQKEKNEKPPETKPSTLQPQILILDRPDLTQSEIRIAFSSISRKDDRYHVLKLMNYLLGGGGFSSRLMEKVRSQKGYTYSIRSSFSSLKTCGTLIISTFTPTDTTYATFEEILLTIEDFIKQGPTEKELKEAKRFFEKSLPLRLETPKQLLNEMISRETYDLKFQDLFEEIEKITKVKIEEIKSIANEILQTQKMQVLIIGNSQHFVKNFEGFKNLRVVPYKDVLP